MNQRQHANIAECSLTERFAMLACCIYKSPVCKNRVRTIFWFPFSKVSLYLHPLHTIPVGLNIGGMVHVQQY